MSAQSRELYVGPRPYEESNAKVFFGREREARDLMSLVIANPLLLIYAPSGAGKTSLINARLLPMLGAVKDPELSELLGPGNGFDILPIARVSGLIPEGIDLDATPGSNIFVFNTLVSWSKKPSGVQTTPERKLAERELLGKRLSDYLDETRPVVAVTNEADEEDEEVEASTPRVVVFDQFEEIFTSHLERWQDREGFFEQITDALKGGPLTLRRIDIRRPQTLLDRLFRDPGSFCRALRERLSVETMQVFKDPEAGVEERLAAVLRQLNAIMKGESLHEPARHAGITLRAQTRLHLEEKRRWRTSLPLNRLLLEDAFPEEIYPRAPGDPSLRIIFSMREDYIAELDPYSHLLPDRLGTRYRLDRLRREAALAAVTNPLQFAHVSFADGVAERLVENLLQTQVRVVAANSEEAAI